MPVVWNPSKIGQAAECFFGFYLINFEKVGLPANGSTALGDFYHSRMRSRFFREDGKPFYKSAESFANAMVGDWVHSVVSTGKSRGKKIQWKNRGEPWVLRKDVKDIATSVYGRYSVEGPPLHSEIEFDDFAIEGRHFNGRIDEIRYGPVVRDLKTGWTVPGEMSMHYDPQATLYNLAIACKAHLDPGFAERIGLTPEEAERLGGNPDFLIERIVFQYYRMRSNEIFVMPRSNTSYGDLCEMVDGFEERLAKGNIRPERGRKCDKCQVHGACDSRTGAKIYPTASNVQLELFWNVPSTKVPGAKTKRPYQYRMKL